MEVRLLKTKGFYPTMKKWWDGHGFPCVDIYLLPEYTFVCFIRHSVPIYSMCFYNTDSNIAWVGWQISNPDIDMELKKGGLKLLFEEVEKYAIYNNYKALFTTSKHLSVEKTLKDVGYSLGDNNVNHYLKII